MVEDGVVVAGILRRNAGVYPAGVILSGVLLGLIGAERLELPGVHGDHAFASAAGNDLVHVHLSVGQDVLILHVHGRDEVPGPVTGAQSDQRGQHGVHGADLPKLQRDNRDQKQRNDNDCHSTHSAQDLQKNILAAFLLFHHIFCKDVHKNLQRQRISQNRVKLSIAYPEENSKKHPMFS